MKWGLENADNAEHTIYQHTKDQPRLHNCLLLDWFAEVNAETIDKLDERARMELSRQRVIAWKVAGYYPDCYCTSQEHEEKVIKMQSNKLIPKGKRSPRMTCTVCNKPNAVRYYVQASVSGVQVTKMIYEHRDEPPESWRTSKGRKIPTYRRCYAGIVRNGLPLLKEEVKIEQRDDAGENFKREFVDSIRELSDIAYDISGDDAKRILNNIWRWLDQKQIELRHD